jgi:hypothetical protein
MQLPAYSQVRLFNNYSPLVALATTVEGRAADRTADLAELTVRSMLAVDVDVLGV